MNKKVKFGFSYFWNRFKQILTDRSFLEKTILKEKSWKPTLYFWGVCNTLVAFIFALGGTVLFEHFVTEFKTKYWNDLPAFEMVIDQGVLETQFLEEPFFYEDRDENFVFIWDTKQAKYLEGQLFDYTKGIFVSGSKITIKEIPNRITEFYFQKFPDKTKITKSSVNYWIEDNTFSFYGISFGILFLIFWIYLNLIRAIMALFWALLFWIMGLLLRVKGWSFVQAYRGVLNFHILPLLLGCILFLNGIFIPFVPLFVFGLVFMLNFWKIEKK